MDLLEFVRAYASTRWKRVVGASFGRGAASALSRLALGRETLGGTSAAWIHHLDAQAVPAPDFVAGRRYLSGQAEGSGLDSSITHRFPLSARPARRYAL
ncbi:hypothetical protein ACIBHX_15360 [Nonomuraea sp. NPDC050536]|uniref:hypothetical protein n=1 Tax=Nonomuraea sp. NPDC050536 TaxID=3364366 RepID=UPI0037C69908